MSDTSHAQPNYVAIWIALLVLLGVSVAAGYAGQKALATALVFGIAAVKAILVIGYYMHLRFEPRWVLMALVSALLLIGALFIGLYPDIVRVYGG